MACVCPPAISIVYGLWIQLFFNQSACEPVFHKLKAFNFSLYILSVLSKQLA